MKTFNIRKILIPIDFSPTSMISIEHAAFMARLFKAELLLVHVIKSSEYHFEIPEPILRVENVGRIQDLAEKKLEEIAEKIGRDYGVKIASLSTNGKIAEEIIKIAEDSSVDLIIMGTHGVSGFEEYFMGSNAQRVVNLARCPVISVQTHAKKIGFNDIVLPIDSSLHSRQKVDHAVELAGHYGAKLHVLGVLESKEDKAKLNIILDQVQNIVESASLPFSRHIEEGRNFGLLTLEYAKKANADLIITMTDHEEEITGGFLGTFAKQIVNHSKIPVMSVRPKVNEKNIPSVTPY